MVRDLLQGMDLHERGSGGRAAEPLHFAGRRSILQHRCIARPSAFTKAQEGLMETLWSPGDQYEVNGSTGPADGPETRRT
jgi:hypothetical protein